MGTTARAGIGSPGAVERCGAADELRYQGLEAAYAVQLERSCVGAEGTAASRRAVA